MRQLVKSILPRRVVDALHVLRNGAPPRDESWLLGMTGTAEQSFYAESAKAVADSPGAIVDLGSWMGSTCIALARGVAESSKPAQVYAFDRYIWEDWMSFDGPRVACDYVPGDSFLPEVRRRTQQFRNIITLIQADLTRYQWNQGEIKLLLVDAMKSAELATAIARSFYPHLRAGSILIHQDFKHYYTPWIHILQYRLRDHCRFRHNVPGSGTLAFELTFPIPAQLIHQSSDFSAITDAEADAAFAWSLALVGNEGRAAIAAAHLMHFVHRREFDRARRRLAHYTDASFRADDGFNRAAQQTNIEP